MKWVWLVKWAGLVTYKTEFVLSGVRWGSGSWNTKPLSTCVGEANTHVVHVLDASTTLVVHVLDASTTHVVHVLDASTTHVVHVLDASTTLVVHVLDASTTLVLKCSF